MNYPFSTSPKSGATDVTAHLKSSNQNDGVIAMARDIAQKTQAFLSAQLRDIVSSGGVAHDVEFCCLNASAILDSMMILHHAVVFNKTNKTRNLLNEANVDEMTYIIDLRNMNTDNRKWS